MQTSKTKAGRTPAKAGRNIFIFSPMEERKPIDLRSVHLLGCRLAEFYYKLFHASAAILRQAMPYNKSIAGSRSRLSSRAHQTGTSRERSREAWLFKRRRSCRKARAFRRP